MRLPRLVSVPLAAALLVPALPLATAHAQDPEAEATPAQDENLAKAQELYAEGQTKYETGDYEEAVALWKQAYAQLPNNQDSQRIRHALVYNIASAELKSYQVSQDVTRLRKARVLLQDYLAGHRKLYGDAEDAKADRAEVEARLAEIEKMLEEAEASEAPPPTEPTEPEPAGPIKASNPADEAKLARMREVRNDPEQLAALQKHNKWILGGGITLGVGGIVFIGGIARFLQANQIEVLDQFNVVDEDDTDAEQRLARITGISLMAIGGVAMGVGGGIMGTGLKRKKELLTPRPTARLLPYGGPNGGGLSLVGRF